MTVTTGSIGSAKIGGTLSRSQNNTHRQVATNGCHPSSRRPSHDIRVRVRGCQRDLERRPVDGCRGGRASGEEHWSRTARLRSPPRHLLHTRVLTSVANGTRKLSPATTARSTRSPRPEPRTRPSRSPTAEPDLSAAFDNVARVNTVAGACGGIETAREVAEAVRPCGSVDAFLQCLDLVAGIRSADKQQWRMPTRLAVTQPWADAAPSPVNPRRMPAENR